MITYKELLEKIDPVEMGMDPKAKQRMVRRQQGMANVAKKRAPGQYAKEIAAIKNDPEREKVQQNLRRMGERPSRPYPAPDVGQSWKRSPVQDKLKDMEDREFMTQRPPSSKQSQRPPISPQQTPNQQQQTQDPGDRSTGTYRTPRQRAQAGGPGAEAEYNRKVQDRAYNRYTKSRYNAQKQREYANRDTVRAHDEVQDNDRYKSMGRDVENQDFDNQYDDYSYRQTQKDKQQQMDHERYRNTQRKQSDRDAKWQDFDTRHKYLGALRRGAANQVSPETLLKRAGQAGNVAKGAVGKTWKAFRNTINDPNIGAATGQVGGGTAGRSGGFSS